jgi:hypothetical protein
MGARTPLLGDASALSFALGRRSLVRDLSLSGIMHAPEGEMSALTPLFGDASAFSFVLGRRSLARDLSSSGMMHAPEGEMSARIPAVGEALAISFVPMPIAWSSPHQTGETIQGSRLNTHQKTRNHNNQQLPVQVDDDASLSLQGRFWGPFHRHRKVSP